MPISIYKAESFILVKEYYRLVGIKAHKAPEDTKLHKAWLILIENGVFKSLKYSYPT